jgi:hypothetical protein
MTNAERILATLDRHLTSEVDLTLYGRAALTLGFGEAPEDYALSRDVDAVLWSGQAEALNETTNFWAAVDETNAELADSGLYVSHFFTEDQVVLRENWRESRLRLACDLARLILYRLSDLDLILSKLMRDDPIDQVDALFIVRRAGIDVDAVRGAIHAARLPESAEVREQFEKASDRLLRALLPDGRDAAGTSGGG